MKKITAIIAVFTVAAAFCLAGCEKQEAPQPMAVEEPAKAPASDMDSTMTTSAPADAPAEANTNE